MNVTPEREENVLFSDPVSEGGIVVAVRAEDLAQGEAAGETAEKKNFFTLIADSLEKNFIRENRWKLILQGLGTTCLMTVLAILFGTVLAFGVCLLRHTGSRLGNIICNTYIRIIQGTPMVVLLMILYYVVMGKTRVGAVWVGIIGFSLNFGA